LFTKTSSTPTTVGGSIVGTKLILSTMNIKEKFGQKVKLLREEKQISIEHLANISNVDRNYISDIEKGKRNISITIMEKIIIALDHDFTTFFNEDKFNNN
jgi:predicted transcriptional regulator